MARPDSAAPRRGTPDPARPQPVTPRPARPHAARRARSARVALAALVLVLAGCGAAPDDVETSTTPEVPPVVGEESIAGLRVLLTNDDSVQAARENDSDGTGLYELRSALCAAGADVVVIGPWQVQSGRGTAVTNSGVVSLAPPLALPDACAGDCADAPSGGVVLGLCTDEVCAADSPSATPVDTVKFALRGGLTHVAGWDDLPDLVVTGSNAGLNVASSVNDSGTIGAAIAAVEEGVPAVAFSTSGDATMAAFPRENYRATAAWGAQLLEGLAARGLLTQTGFALSVNYPDLTSGEAPAAATWVQVGTGVVALHGYEAVDDSTFTVGLSLCEGLTICEEERADADSVAVMSGRHVTVGAIAPDRTYGAEVEDRAVLDAIAQYVRTEAPAPVS